MNIQESIYANKAMSLFKEGYNCAQSVFLAFGDQYHMDTETAARLSSSFGGGLGRMREVCGAVSGMAMVAGILYGYDSPADYEGKSAHYARIQELAYAFREQNGSYVCRELLGLAQKNDSPIPEKRTEEYYKKRPCAELVGMAAAIMEQYIANHPVSSVNKNPDTSRGC
uniref:C-GCAxxG-C-C family protein n=1 Tax=Acetatifactor sp. TaxID=1872090 RepID=UPI004055ACED